MTTVAYKVEKEVHYSNDILFPGGYNHTVVHHAGIKLTCQSIGVIIPGLFNYVKYSWQHRLNPSREPTKRGRGEIEFYIKAILC